MLEQRDAGLSAAELAARAEEHQRGLAGRRQRRAPANVIFFRGVFRHRDAIPAMPRSNSAGTPTQTLPRASTQQITISWQADDPDGDRLVYNVYFRGEDETQWKVLEAATHDTSLTFDADILADGKYLLPRGRVRPRSRIRPPRAREAILIARR